MLASHAGGSDPVREIDVRTLHQLVLSTVSPDEAGRYSAHERAISGSPLRLPSPLELPALMREFGMWLENADLAPETAFDAHEKLVTIHPFSDGNGRTARLLMNLLLIRAGYPPLVIVPEDRAAYHESLHALQIEIDRAAWHAFLYERLARSLEHTLRVLHAGA